jgi:hypothetical protein
LLISNPSRRSPLWFIADVSRHFCLRRISAEDGAAQVRASNLRPLYTSGAKPPIGALARWPLGAELGWVGPWGAVAPA